MTFIKFPLKESISKLPELPQWEILNDNLHREIAYNDFVEACEFMTRVALLADNAEHHPEWFNLHNKVRIALYTYDVKGISQTDFDLASKIDRLLDN